MFESFLVTFREGMEAFLIVFIMIAYLRKTGRDNLVTPIFLAIPFAVLASIGVAYAMENYISNQELAEGLMATVAGALVITLTVHMLKAAKHIKQTITKALEKAASRPGFWATAGIFAFTLLMITREGMEVALFIGALSYEVAAVELTIGALAGVAAAIALGVAWVKYSHLINLGRFLQVTAIFLILFSAHLVMYGFHELTESGSLPYLDNAYWHQMTEGVDQETLLGQVIAYSIVGIPLAWLAFVIIQDRRRTMVAFNAATGHPQE